MQPIIVETEFCNSRQLLESATGLIQGTLDVLIAGGSRQYATLEIALRYLLKLDEVLRPKPAHESDKSVDKLEL
jgi:hypothetical protein